MSRYFAVFLGLFLAVSACRKNGPDMGANPATPSPKADPKPADNKPTDTKPPETRYFAYRSPDGRFAVAFPWRQAAQRTRTQNTPFGQITDTAFEVENWPNSALLAVADFASPQLMNANLEQVVTAGRDAVAQGNRATVAKDARKSERGIIVRDVVFNIPGKNGQGPAYFRYLIHGRRLYTLAILSDGSVISEVEKEAFFNSLKILK